MGIFRKLKQWVAGIGVSVGIGIARSQAKKNLSTNKPVKDALHFVNKAIQSRFVAEGDGKQKALQYAKDLMMLAHAYTDAYGDKDSPSCISDEERDALDLLWDGIVDKYVPQDRIAEWIDLAFDYAEELVKKSV